MSISPIKYPAKYTPKRLAVIPKHSKASKRNSDGRYKENQKTYKDSYLESLATAKRALIGIGVGTALVASALTVKDNIPLKQETTVTSEVQSQVEERNLEENLHESMGSETYSDEKIIKPEFGILWDEYRERELDAFFQKWEKNKDIYESLEEETSVPAELIAAIHYRESSNDFTKSIRNGEGNMTFDEWYQDAVDTMNTYVDYCPEIEIGNLYTYYDFAEHYNGLGYRNAGKVSPYIWAGTDKCDTGLYTSDGKFENIPDKRIGVAVILNELYA